MLALIAIAWQVGSVVLERSLNRFGTISSLLRLLFAAEIELLRSLRVELEALSDDGYRTAILFRVEQRLRELGEYG
ncbi:MAG: hypothetical protein H5T49_01135 [Hadesarchaea archaeon]|nr:hypothetical protein [Hadesarchaea archaeon]